MTIPPNKQAAQVGWSMLLCSRQSSSVFGLIFEVQVCGASVQGILVEHNRATQQLHLTEELGTELLCHETVKERCVRAVR